MLLLVSFLIEYYNEMQLIEADILTAKSSRPPLACGPLSLTLNELDWFDWIRHKLDDRSEELCLAYLQRIHRSRWPPPLDVFIKMFATTIGQPIRIWMNLFGHGLRSILNKHNFILQIILIIVVVFAFVYGFKLFLYSHFLNKMIEHRKPTLPFYQNPSFSKLQFDNQKPLLYNPNNDNIRIQEIINEPLTNIELG